MFNPVTYIIKSKIQQLKEILHHILHVTLFLGELGLAFRGDSNRLDDPNNGNFLGILELLSHYDLVLKQHLDRVRESQKNQTEASSKLSLS